MKAQTLGLLFSFTAIGLSHALAILPAQEHGQDPTRRNNWGKNEPHLSSEEADQSKTRDDGTRVRKAEEGKGADPKFKEAKGKDSKGYDSKMKNGKGENDKDNDGKQQGDKNKDGKGKADKVKYCDYPTKIDPPIDLPAPGMPIHKPLPRFDTPPRVLPNSDNYIDGSLVDEFEPRVILVGKYIERLARQTPPIHIDFSNDEGPVYDEQEAVDILPDDYCIPEDVYNTTLQNFNCTTYQGDGNPFFGDTSDLSRRSLEAGTYARVFPQIYRWRRGSVITISVERNTKPILMDLNVGISGASPAYVLVRASEITAAAMSRAYKYWNRASIGVTFAWSMDLGRSTYVTRTGGTEGAALATADYPAQANGHQRTINAWDSMLELEWQPVGPNIISHELGHALGLGHNDAPSDKVYELWDESGFSLMDSGANPDTNVITRIPARDAGGAHILYNQMNPPISRNRTVVILRAPQGPNLFPPFIRFCKWGLFGICFYY